MFKEIQIFVTKISNTCITLSSSFESLEKGM